MSLRVATTGLALAVAAVSTMIALGGGPLLPEPPEGGLPQAWIPAAAAIVLAVGVARDIAAFAWAGAGALLVFSVMFFLGLGALYVPASVLLSAAVVFLRARAATRAPTA